MPTYTVRVEDPSPMIHYDSGWLPGNDEFLANYSAANFHATNVAGSTATFSFFGTGCKVFGAKRSNHGQYSVVLDGGAPFNNDGLAPDPPEFQQLLYQSPSNLPLSNHTISIANGPANGAYLDIDWIEFITGDNNPDTATNSTHDDADSSVFQYLPSTSAWPPVGQDVGSLNNGGTLHSTTQANAQAVVKFTGNAAYIFGTSSSGHGSFSVQVDNSSPQTFNGSNTSGYTTNVLLYYAGGLGPGSHSITLTNLEQSKKMEVDYMVASTYALQPTSQNGTNDAVGQPAKAKTPIIAGAVSGACILLAWIIAMVYFFMRRKKRRLEFAEAERKAREPADAYILPPDPAVLQGQRRPGDYHNNEISAAHLGSQTQRDSLATNIMLSPAHRSKAAESGFAPVSHGRTPSDPRGYVAQSQGSSRDDRSYYPPSSNSDTDRDQRRLVPSPPESRTLSHQSRPSQASLIRSPSSDNTVNSPGEASGGGASHIRLQYSPQELSTSRMQVADRPQDWGPIREEDILPPNYEQAIEPLPNRVPPVRQPSR